MSMMRQGAMIGLIVVAATGIVPALSQTFVWPTFVPDVGELYDRLQAMIRANGWPCTIHTVYVDRGPRSPSSDMYEVNCWERAYRVSFSRGAARVEPLQ